MGSSAATKYQLDLAGGRQHEPDGVPGSTVRGALFADLTDDEQDELLEYLAWYRARKRSKRSVNGES